MTAKEKKLFIFNEKKKSFVYREIWMTGKIV